MATPKIVPRAEGGGALGSAALGWGAAFVTNITTSSASQGGILTLAANDGQAMASGHRLGAIVFSGAEDDADNLTAGATIQCITDDAWSGSENGASLVFYTTDGDASSSRVLTLDSDKLASFHGTLNTTGAATLASLVCTAGATFGGGTGSTGATITTAGVGTFDGAVSSTAGAVTGRNYKTIYVDAGSMVPTGGADGAESETQELATNDVMYDFLAFDTSQDEFAQFKLVMPEQWDAGTIRAKFYWTPTNTNTGDVAWFIQARAHAQDGAMDQAFGTAVSVHTADDVGNGTANQLHITNSTTDMTVATSGSLGEGQMVMFQVYRDVSADNYDADARLLGVSLQYRESATASAVWPTS